MQRADFKCESCGKVEEIEWALADGPPDYVECSECGGEMKRVFAAAIHIPEWFGDHTHTVISEHMKHADRPTGKQRTLY